MYWSRSSERQYPARCIRRDQRKLLPAELQQVCTNTCPEARLWSVSDLGTKAAESSTAARWSLDPASHSYRSTGLSETSRTQQHLRGNCGHVSGYRSYSWIVDTTGLTQRSVNRYSSASTEASSVPDVGARHWPFGSGPLYGQLFWNRAADKAPRAPRKQLPDGVHVVNRSTNASVWPRPR